VNASSPIFLFSPSFFDYCGLRNESAYTFRDSFQYLNPSTMDYFNYKEGGLTALKEGLDDQI